MNDISVRFIHPNNKANFIQVELEDSSISSEIIDQLIEAGFLQSVQSGYTLKVRGSYHLAENESLAQAGVAYDAEIEIEKRQLILTKSNPLKKIIFISLLMVPVLLGVGYYLFPDKKKQETTNISSSIEKQLEIPVVTEDTRANSIILNLEQALEKIGNNNIDPNIRDRMISSVLSKYFSSGARIMEVGKNGTIVEIINAEEFLNYLSTMITLKDIEVKEYKMSSSGDKVRELAIYTQHQTNM